MATTPVRQASPEKLKRWADGVTRCLNSRSWKSWMASIEPAESTLDLVSSLLYQDPPNERSTASHCSLSGAGRCVVRANWLSAGLVRRWQMLMNSSHVQLSVGYLMPALSNISLL